MPQLLGRAAVAVGIATLVAPAIASASVSASASGGASPTVLPYSLSHAPPGAVRTNTVCSVSKYRTHVSVTKGRTRASVLHLSTYGIGPDSIHTVVETGSPAATLRAGWNLPRGASVSGRWFAKLIAQVDRRFGGRFRDHLGTTTRPRTTVTHVLSNRTSQNAQYVLFFVGRHAQGRFRYSWCDEYYVGGQNYGPWYVTYYAGTWATDAAPRSRAVSCARGGQERGAPERHAFATGCAA